MIILQSVVSYKQTVLTSYGMGAWAIISFLRSANAASLWYDGMPRFTMATPSPPSGNKEFRLSFRDGQGSVAMLTSLFIDSLEWVRYRVRVWRNVGGDDNWYAKITLSRYPSGTVIYDSAGLLVWDYAWGPLPGRLWQIANGHWDGSAQNTYLDQTIVEYP